MGIVDGIEDWDLFAQKLGVADKNFVDFLNNAKYGEKTLDNYKLYLKDIGKEATGMGAAFAASLKSMAANIGIMLAITLAIKGAMWIFDQLYTSFEEQQEIVDDLTDKIKGLQEEYDNLKDDPSASGEKLDYLKRQINL